MNPTATLLITLLSCVTASAGPVAHKKIVGGHGLAMVSTCHLKQYIEEMQRAPLDGVLVNVNRNAYAADPKWRQARPHNWFRPPAVTIADFSIALEELAATDLGRFKHNMLWTSGSRRFPGDWFDDEAWEKIILPNARVMAEVYRRGEFAALWFDVEVGGAVPGGVMTWKAAPRESLHAFDAYAAKARQRGRELMAAFTAVVPDFKLVISHGYGSVAKMLDGRGAAGLSEINYGLLPAFCDGLLAGCGDRGQLVESGETTYGTMTYPAYMAWRRWDQRSAEWLCGVPELLARNYRHANAVWIDFEARSEGWHEDDPEHNHFSPERMRHAFHNALCATDEFVWTYSQNAHWWPNRTVMPSYDRRWTPMSEDRRKVLGGAYLDAVARCREPMDLHWHPERTTETEADVPGFDADEAFATPAAGFETILELDDGWQFHPADSSTASAFDWGIGLNRWSDGVLAVYDWRPIAVGDAWENQGIGLDGTGVYRRQFRLPDDAAGKRIHVALAGVAGRATVFVARRGSRPKSVGRTEGAPAALFDVTEAVDFAGRTDLTIVVTSRAGAGGIYGAVRILGRPKGRDGYVALRGRKRGEWFQWIRTTRLGNFEKLALENTVEARVRVPDAAPLTAEIYCTTEDGGWTIRLHPRGVFLGRKHVALNATAWHTYRVVNVRNGDRYDQTLYVDGEPRLSVQQAPLNPEEPRGSAIGLGTGWGTEGAEGTHPIKMDVDYIRWSHRPFTPEDERTAGENAPEARTRKAVFWDGAYEGDVMPEADGWKWWYHHDGRPFTQIAYFREAVDLSDTRKLVTLYDWTTGAGARMIPRDVPRLDVANEVHALITPVEQMIGDDAFAARIVVRSAKEVGYGWPAITFTQMAPADWSPYAAVAVRLHNFTDKAQAIGLSIRDGDRQSWFRLEDFAPGETRVLSATIDELRTRVLVSDLFSLTLWTKETGTPQSFLASPVYLVKRQTPPVPGNP